MGIKDVKEEKGLFDGYRTQEQRDLAMLTAALNNNPDYFGDMTPEQKKEYDKMVEWVKTVPKGCSIDVGYNMD